MINASGSPRALGMIVPLAASLLAGCAACPFYEQGRIVSRDSISAERIADTLDEALKPMKFSRRACKPTDNSTTPCGYIYTVPGLIGVGSTQVSLSVSDLSVQLVDYNRSESKLDRQVTDAIRTTVRARLDADIEFEKKGTSYGCLFGP